MNSKLLNERIQIALDMLTTTDLKKMPLGRNDVNDWLYINVQEYDTKLVSECRFEAHRKYVDIQMMIDGIEAIETADIDKLQVTEEYNEEKDVMFLESKPEQMKSIIRDGSYVILYPQNAHMPCVAVGKPAKVRKLVAKVLIP